MRLEGQHNFPEMERVIYGKPAAQAVLAEVDLVGAKRVFFLASRTLNTKTEEIEKIRKALGDRYAGTYDGMPQHTTRKACLDAAGKARDAGADLIVAIGGGSIMDAAKIVPMLMGDNPPTEASLDDYVGIEPKIRFQPPPFRVVVVPSTLNAGEFNAAALVTDERTNLKQIFFHPLMMPVSVIMDPELAMLTPTELWFGSGTRAMDHGIEALCSRNGTPLTDAVVLAGIRALRDGMLATLADPTDLEARRLSQHGAWLAASGLQVRVMMGASHGIGHVLGGTFNVPHYFCTSVMMPSILRYNAPSTGEAQVRLAEALRAKDGQDAPTALRALFDKFGLPSTLKQVGVEEANFDKIASIAINHMFVKLNPHPITNEADVKTILKLAA